MTKIVTNLDEYEMSNIDHLLQLAKQLNFGDIHIKLDANTGLHAIIAIHDTTLGPALGGCRCIEYQSIGAAFIDAIRLARGMTLKAALADIPQGGGKAVLLKPNTINNRSAYFKAFGKFVEQLNGRYITAKDSGITAADLDLVATETKYVTCTSSENNNVDPSPYTATGVLNGIRAAVKYRWDRNDLTGLHVAIQGAGAVGSSLAEQLHQSGAKITLCDVDPSLAKQCAMKVNANIVAPEQIYSVACDIFAPCALGSIINEQTITQLQCAIIAGSANNQLQDHEYGMKLAANNILYAPDYLINSGGLISASIKFHQGTDVEITNKIDNIYFTALEIFERAATTKQATNIVSADIAQERLQQRKKS